MSRALAALTERAASLGEELRRAPEPTLRISPGVQQIVTTGLGSSAAHARILASVLDECGHLPARFVPTAALAERAPAGSRDAALVVFSQGASPNARLAWTHADAFAQLVVVSSGRASPERRPALDAIAAAGATVVDPGCGAEFGTLLRIAGPLLGSLSALRIARTLGAEVAIDVDALASAVDRATLAGRAAADVAPFEPSSLRVLSAGWHAERCDNLRLKLVEGLCVPLAPVDDAIAIAHGPLQASYDAPACWLVCTDGAPSSQAAVERVRRCLDAERHRLVEVPTEARGPAAILEQEAWCNGFVLRGMERAAIDPARWPGRDRDRAIYEVGATTATPTLAAPDRRLATSDWPGIDAALDAGGRRALLPLGSTEQHGPHLPFATDTWIAEALAARWAARDPACVALPALPLGCASEHLGFPGTLSIATTTLVSILDDVANSVAHHGFHELVVFSAHGGNLPALRDAEPGLRERSDLVIRVVTDAGPVNDALAAIGAAHGLAPEALGPHAGELETSILLAIAPASVRLSELAPGRTGPPIDDDALFYPDLRRNAPTGVVGDPRGASAARGECYLDAWVDVLVALAETEAPGN